MTSCNLLRHSSILGGEQQIGSLCALFSGRSVFNLFWSWTLIEQNISENEIHLCFSPKSVRSNRNHDDLELTLSDVEQMKKESAAICTTIKDNIIKRAIKSSAIASPKTCFVHDVMDWQIESIKLNPDHRLGQRIGSQHQEFYFVVDVILINPYACKIEYDAPEQSVLII